MSEYRSVSHSGGIGIGWVAFAIVFHAVWSSLNVDVVRVSDTTVTVFSVDGFKICDTVSLSCRRINTLVPK